MFSKMQYKTVTRLKNIEDLKKDSTLDLNWSELQLLSAEKQAIHKVAEELRGIKGSCRKRHKLYTNYIIGFGEEIENLLKEIEELKS